MLDHRVYDAFGNITSETNPSQGDDYGFQGMQFEATVSLYETVWRQYDPTTGKWTTMDPSGLTPNSNPYRFVGNGPTDGTDPSGLISLMPSPPRMTDKPWILHTNWSSATGDQVFLQQGVDIKFSSNVTKAKLERVEQNIYDGLKKFEYLNVKDNNLATIKVLEIPDDVVKAHPELEGRRYGEIKNRSLSTTLNMTAVGLTDGVAGEFYVELFSDDKAYTVSAVTLGRHPIVGIRIWRVKLYGPDKNGESHIYVETITWEHRDGLLGDLGFWHSTGLADTKKLWDNYLNNIAQAAIKDAGEGDAVRSTRIGDGNLDADAPDVMFRYNNRDPGRSPLIKYLPERSRP